MENERVVKAYWEKFLSDTGRDKGATYYFCGYMGPTEEIANQLLKLILSGQKRATTSCLLSYEAYNEPLPKAGDLSVVTDWAGTPKCVIENTAVTVLPFREMTFDICCREGEDDILETWQNTHFNIFTEEGKAAGYVFTVDTPVVFEDFKVIYR